MPTAIADGSIDASPIDTRTLIANDTARNIDLWFIAASEQKQRFLKQIATLINNSFDENYCIPNSCDQNPSSKTSSSWVNWSKKSAMEDGCGYHCYVPKSKVFKSLKIPWKYLPDAKYISSDRNWDVQLKSNPRIERW